MRHRTFFCPVLLACLSAVWAQPRNQPQKQSQPVPATQPVASTGTPSADIGNIVVKVQEVIVPVTVTDSKGKFVSDLEQKDFTIFDEGRPQNISYFTRERNQPVVVGFLVDQSNAVKLNWKTYMEAITDLIVTLMPGGDKKFSGYLISYGNEAELLVDTTQDPEKLISKVRKMKPGGGSTLFDAIYQSCTTRSLVKGEPIEPRRIIVIIGDGHDNASKHTLDQVLELAQRNLVTIYGVSTTGYGMVSEGTDNMKRLTEETGGRTEFPLENVYKDVSGYLSTPSDDGNYALTVGTGGYASAIAANIFKAIAAVTGEITTQYILRYTPEITEKSANTPRRRIEVKVNLTGVNVHARKGYYPHDLN
jgi:Ca-activated chloride channel family protein